jgi:hypothetical protein
MHCLHCGRFALRSRLYFRGCFITRCSKRHGVLAALDDRPTFLTSVPDDAAFGACEFLEFVALGAGVFETFGTVTIAQFFFGDTQMTMPTTDCFLPLRQ